MSEGKFEKLKFYDGWFKVLGVSLILGIIFFFISMSYDNDILIGLVALFLISAFLSAIIIFWGMVYHEYKRKDWGWFVSTIIIAVLFGAGVLVSILYYFIVMRKEFKKGKGIYDEELSKREKEKIEYYKEHKSKIDKEENQEFIKFLKIIGTLIGILILFFIISKIFF